MRLHQRNLFPLLLISTIPLIYIAVVQFLLGNSISIPEMFIRWISIISIVISIYYLIHSQKYWAILTITIFSVLWQVVHPTTLSAWILSITILSSSIYFSLVYSADNKKYKQILIYTLACISSTLLLFYFYQRDERFSDEELYLFLQWLTLVGFWSILAVSNHAFYTRIYKSSRKRNHIEKTDWAYILINVTVLLITIALVIIQYQNSFYPKEFIPTNEFTGSQPFYCEFEEPTQLISYSSDDVYQKIIKLVENNPEKKSPDYAFLALATGGYHWAQLFRETLLLEAKHGQFTEPANSIKYGQYLSSKRAYFFPLVKKQFPELFTTEDNDIIETWFARINQRAHDIEWIDWLYALAYQKVPEGPYENQEVGAGLLATLELNHLSDVLLTESNNTYLKKNDRGWTARFRNTDDAAVYQPIWLDNAFMQSLYLDKVDVKNKQLSYDWLLLQSPPDGSPITYNHTDAALIADTAYQGAALLDNEIALWIAGQSADYLLSNNMYLNARPGMESSIHLEGTPPNFESCLLFGDSGLPNQIGPVTPDKIVFRNGWGMNASYLLTNLRFTGWHRYKAPNTISSVYQNGPIIVEKMLAEPLSWMPAGRSIFRDKRIPRENLNGLVVQQSGMGLIMKIITGLGSDWAQDPPFYANIVDFHPGQDIDFAHLRLESWRNWDHDRLIYFSEYGPTIIYDNAIGPKYQDAAITWHAIGEKEKYREYDSIYNEATDSRVVYIPIHGGKNTYESFSTNLSNGIESFHFTDDGHISIITIILTKDWANAEIDVDENKDTVRIKITNDKNTIIQTLELLN